MMDVLLKRRLLTGNEHWLISEIDARDIPGSQRDRCLICQNDSIVRRIWDYPDDWVSMSDSQISALFEFRPPSPSRSAPSASAATAQIEH